MSDFIHNHKHSGLDKLVERQIKHWEADKLKLLREGKPKPKNLNTVITISRQLGAGGEETAEFLAGKLNYRLLDKEIVEEIAKKSSRLDEVLREMDEAGFTWVEETMNSIFSPGLRIPTKEFFKHLCEVVLISASYGKVIFIGRGANLILKEPEIFRVRLVAPYELRVQRVQESEKISQKEAEKLIKESDKRRSIFIKSYFKTNLDDATIYDLVLNTEWLTIAEAADLLVNAFTLHKAKYPS